MNHDAELVTPGLPVLMIPVAADGTWCPCVLNHNPEPVEDEVHHLVPRGSPFGGMDTPENRRRLCGTAHGSVHAYLRMVLSARTHGVPLDRVRARHFSPFVRRCAEVAIHALDQAQDRPIDPDRPWITATWGD